MWEAPAVGEPVKPAKPAPTEAADFFVELGTEELPAADVASCAAQMRAAIESCLSTAGLKHDGVDRRCHPSPHRRSRLEPRGGAGQQRGA